MGDIVDRVYFTKLIGSTLILPVDLVSYFANSDYQYREPQIPVALVTRGKYSLEIYRMDDWEIFSGRLRALPMQDKQYRMLKGFYMCGAYDGEIEDNRMDVSTSLASYFRSVNETSEYELDVVMYLSRNEIYKDERYIVRLRSEYENANSK